MYTVIKKNKKLIIIDSHGACAYSMPFWVRVPSRKELQELADRFNRVDSYCIDAIMEFETKFSTVKKKAP